MQYLVPRDAESIDPSWWAPLEGIERAVVGVPAYRFFDIDEFITPAGTSTSTTPAMRTGTSNRAT